MARQMSDEGLMRPSTAAGDGIEMGHVRSAAPQMRMSVGGQHIEVVGPDGVTTVKEVKKTKSKRQEGSRAVGSRAMGSRATGSTRPGQDPWDARRPSIDDVSEEDIMKPSFKDVCMERAVPFSVVCCLFIGLPTAAVAIFNRSEFESGASCSTMTCPANFLPKDDMSSLLCQESECTLASDATHCCDQKARCSTLPCPSGYFDILGKSSTRCRGNTCVESTDLETCCEPAGTCPMGLSTHCPENFAVAPRSDGVVCNHVWCDQEECCSATCAGVRCGIGLLDAYLLVDNGHQRFCNNAEGCDSNERSENSDVPNCCVARCSSKQCPTHFELIEAGEAASTACATLACDDPSDMETCCREHARCAAFTCPEGTAPKPSSEELHCRNLVCDHLGDADVCCDNVPAI